MRRGSGRRPRLGTFVLFLLSGMAALAYQVLWARELSLLFGSTAQAAAMTVAIFFAGLALGGWWWGRRAGRARDPLATFGWLEVAVAGTALAFLGLVEVVVAVEPVLLRLLGDGPVADTLLRAGVATLVLLPPSILMGGTLPMLGQELVDTRHPLGRIGSALYAVNTLGSAAGALVAGLLLPGLIGYLGTYLVAVGVDAAVGVTALVWAARSRADRGPAPRTPGPVEVAAAAASEPTTQPPPDPRVVRLAAVVAVASGVLTLAVEVVWTRLFSQVLHNSVYTYAVVLASFLVALAAGAVLANRLARPRAPSPAGILPALLAAGGLVTVAAPWWFHRQTEGLQLVGGTAGFGAYVGEVALLALVVMVLPVSVLGTVLPYLLRVLQHHAAAPGDTIGRLVAANTAGGVVGALAGGFLLLPVLGAWRSLVWVGAVYGMLASLAAVVLRPAVSGRAGRAVAVAPALGAIALVMVTAGQDLAPVHLRPGGGQRLVEVREGPGATVSVVSEGADLQLRVDNHYVLGGTRALDAERNQSVVPLLVRPAPRSVFYLGMGTGITAGAGLAFEVDRVVVCELIGEVVDLARAHFTPWTGGLFTDPRAEVRAADGRTCLRRTTERYDLIISDLFTPWEAGTGNLYTLEQYRTGQQRLRPGGAYVQWVPLYQVTDAELGTIAATMDAVFDEVTVWRGDLYAERSIVALVGRDDPQPLDPTVIPVQAAQLDGGAETEPFYEALALRMYVGNLTASGLYADRPLNTDRRPVVEYGAPRSQRAVRAGDASFVTGAQREALYDRLVAAVPVGQDPALAALDARQRGYVEAGRAYSRFRHLDAAGDPAAEEFLARFVALSPPDGAGPQDISPAARLLPRVLPGTAG